MTSAKTKGHVRTLMSFAICGSLCGEPAFAEPGFFQRLGETLASVAPDHYSPTIVLYPGAVLTFGDQKYAIFGTDSCLPGSMDNGSKQDLECVTITPGMGKMVTLVPVGSEDPLRAEISTATAAQTTIIELTSLLYPDGRVQSFTPPLIGGAVE